jgi:hypothetical protein
MSNVTGLSRDLVAPAVAREPIKVPKAPNIIVLMTDQERHHRHWPVGWTEKNLPSLHRLKRHGLYFQRAYTAACQCSPPRALRQTGRFAPVNRVTQTFLWPGLVHKDRQPNVASLLKEKAGYEVLWKGKWHLRAIVIGLSLVAPVIAGAQTSGPTAYSVGAANTSVSTPSSSTCPCPPGQFSCHIGGPMGADVMCGRRNVQCRRKCSARNPRNSYWLCK